jgi:hypothetical protein
LLIRRRIAPVTTCRQRRHALKIDVRQNFFIDNLLDTTRIAVLNILVRLGNRHHFFADALDQHIRCFLRGRITGKEHCGECQRDFFSTSSYFSDPLMIACRKPILAELTCK